MYLFGRSLGLCIAVYSLIGAILMNLRNKKEKLYFLATKYVNKPSEQFAVNVDRKIMYNL
jgi:hypothetical protein